MSEAQNTTEFDLPDDAQYGGYPITEAGYNHELDRIYVIYEGDDLPDGWEQLIFTGCEWNGGSPVLDPNGTPAGIMRPDALEPWDTPGAKEAKALYDLLRDCGVTIEE